MIAAMELETKIRSRRKGRFGLGGHYTTQTKALLFSTRTEPPPFPFCYPCERNKFMSTKQKKIELYKMQIRITIYTKNSKGSPFGCHGK